MVKEEEKVDLEVEVVDNLHKSHRHHCCCSVLDIVQYSVSICYSEFAPLFAAFEFALCLPPTCDVVLLPHPIEAAVEPTLDFSNYYGFAASISHHVSDVLPWKQIHLYVVEDLLEEELHVAQQVREMVKEQGVEMEREVVERRVEEQQL